MERSLGPISPRVLGAAYGYAQIPSQTGIRRVSLWLPIRNLFFAGAILSGCKCAVWVNEPLPRRSRAKPTLENDTLFVALLTLGRYPCMQREARFLSHSA